MNINLPKFNHFRVGYNKQIRYFFIRLLLLITAWFFFYGILLKPARTIDRPLSNFLTGSVVVIVNAISPNADLLSWAEDPNLKKESAYIIQNGYRVFRVMDGCNGIDLMIIYLGIIILLPYTVKRKILFSFGGVAMIIAANIIRILLLYLIYIYYRTAFDFSHHYLFTILMYLLIFYGWLLYIKKDKNYETGS